MNVREFLQHLCQYSESNLRFVLPDRTEVAAHFHITEVGYVLKRFVDCGGTRRVQENCLLQTWVHDDVEHRLTAGKLARIFEHSADVLPHTDLPVEIEHERDAVSQFRVESVRVRDGELVFDLVNKQTDCLARGVCLPGECAPAPVPRKVLDFSIKAGGSSCSPGSGCC
jgi:hypothetical protein